MQLPFTLEHLPKQSTASWGPPTAIPSSLNFHDVPYAPYSKSDKLGKAADWLTDPAAAPNAYGNTATKSRNTRDPFHAYGTSAASSFAAEEEEEAGDFSVVDSSTSAKVAATVLKRNSANQAAGSYSTALGAKRGATPAARASPAAARAAQQATQPQQFGNRRRYGSWKDDFQARIRDASIDIQDSWEVVYDAEFHKLTKLNMEVKEVEDLDSYGSVAYYNKQIERPLSNQTLQAEARAVVSPTASEDAVLVKLAAASSGAVFTTDTCLAQLMCAARSVYSWDMVITKKADTGAIFIDKRENSILDRETVDENTQDAPSDSKDTDINNATNLAQEATSINQNFIAQSLAAGKPYSMAHPEAPFTSTKGYKYRKFKLPVGNASSKSTRHKLGNDEEEDAEDFIGLVVRAEVDSVQATGEKLTIRALNEYVPPATAQQHKLDWKTKLQTQKGAIIAAELKKNNNKVAKWATSALLADNDSLKLGFVSRVNQKANSKHVVLAVNTYKPQDLAISIGLSLNNGWAVVKSFVDIVNNRCDQEEDKSVDQKFVLVKNPNAPKITLYKV
ncbi:hypothetical protein BABINDRAFT_163276 [Babjeviella inositovora NRRL Y-12698]|uniref:Eukaryotic translation initiation factor 3 subunit D n=1 Tax=Babjeviella inositovora NRRL Y-12698 TaxID=984486 RepID=A0A1E3QJN2_9ASCO|nr:uncharacterized protein BABINDRAFT_163276 [Babjeviella inositovora NRRL Y-12698]ODQ77905.1 hypothetical protein BABINDRAFT_163276 [Babjeviella inositovora NRRL Y-12698]